MKKSLKQAYVDLVNIVGVPPKFLPAKSAREKPVMLGQLLDVPMPDEYSGEEIPAGSQKDTFADDCASGFTGVAVYSGRRHPYPARHAASAYAAHQLANGNIVSANKIRWQRVSGHSFRDDALDGAMGDIYQPDLLIIDALYLESSTVRIEKIRSYVDLDARSTIIIATGMSPVDAAYRKLNVDFGRALYFI